MDHMAQRYHLLPSQILRKADSLDYVVMTAAMQWEHQRNNSEEAQPKSGQKLTQQQLQQMIDRVRNR
jgi:hypothetical protein